MTIGIAYVANKPGLGIGVPSAGNTSLHGSLAAAKAAPLPSIAEALKLAGPDRAIVLGPGIYDGQVRLTTQHSGVSGRPFLLISETPHGAVVRGPIGSGEKSAVWTTGCYDFEIHNVAAEVRAGNGADNSAFKIFRNSGDPYRDTGIVIAGCKGWGNGRDVIKISGVFGAKVLGCDLTSDGGFFGDSGIDANVAWGCELRFNRVTGRFQNGIAVKGGARKPLIERNIVDVRQKEAGISWSPALFFGHSGTSHTGSAFPFNGLDWDWAEIAEGVARWNLLRSDWRIAVWCIGAWRGLIEHNVLGNRGDGDIISMGESKTGRWSGMPPVPAEHAAYVHVDNANADLLHFDSRFLTIRNNVRLAGSSGGIGQQHPGTNDVQVSLPVVGSASEHIAGPIGPEGWDNATILRRIEAPSLPPEIPTEPVEKGMLKLVNLTDGSNVEVTNEMSIPLSAIGSDRFNLVYERGAGETFQSVLFTVDEGRHSNLQSIAPYDLFSPASGPGVLFTKEGITDVVLDFYSQTNGSGTLIETRSFAMVVEDNNPMPEPQPGDTSQADFDELVLRVTAIEQELERLDTRLDAIAGAAKD